MMRVAVVDYGSGNLTSAARALARSAELDGIAAEITVTADPAFVAAADRVVLPGQGAFADCAAGLCAVDGMREAIDSSASAGRPFLGICVGMQLMAEHGLEHTTTPGFGWVAGDVAEMAAPGRKWAGTRSTSNRATLCWTGSPRATTFISCTATPYAARGRPR
jgi:glutamine amidotransferase